MHPSFKRRGSIPELRSKALSTLAFLLFGLVWGVLPAGAQSPLTFVIDNQTYLYNQEIGEELDTYLQAEGFTLTGNLFKPYFQFDVRKNLRLEVGVLLDIPFGDKDRVDEVDPVISLHYGFSPGWLFTVGTIDRNHPLHDGIFNDKLRYEEPIEQGFQLKGDTQHIRQDLWISWEERESTTRREKFSIGDYTQIKMAGFMVDAQLLWVHLGGQQNTGPGVFNNLSYGFGAGYTYRPSGFRKLLGFIEEIGVMGHFLKNIDEPPGLAKVEDSGVALRGFLTVWDTYIYYLRWDGGSINFNSPRGDITMPNMALAKGDPLYRSDQFDEVGIVKTWEFSEEIIATADFRAQFLRGRFANVFALNVTWRPQFPLFEDYFKNRTPAKPDRPEPPFGRPYGF